MPEAEITARALAALRNPCVKILAIDLGKVVARLELGDTMARIARDARRRLRRALVSALAYLHHGVTRTAFAAVRMERAMLSLRA